MTQNIKDIRRYQWSDWFPLLCCALLEKNVPHEPGIYEIRLNREFGRVRGTTRIVNIGRARDSLYKRVYRDKACNSLHHFSGTMKWLVLEDAKFEVRWLVTSDKEEAEQAEKKRLAEFICRHWELPPGQPRGPEGYGTDLKVRKLIDRRSPEYIDIDLSVNDISGFNDPVRKCDDNQ